MSIEREKQDILKRLSLGESAEAIAKDTGMAESIVQEWADDNVKQAKVYKKASVSSKDLKSAILETAIKLIGDMKNNTEDKTTISALLAIAEVQKAFFKPLTR